MLRLLAACNTLAQLNLVLARRPRSTAIQTRFAKYCIEKTAAASADSAHQLRAIMRAIAVLTVLLPAHALRTLSLRMSLPTSPQRRRLFQGAAALITFRACEAPAATKTAKVTPVQMLELGAIFPTQMGQNKAADHQGWVLINNNILLAYYLQGCQFLG